MSRVPRFHLAPSKRQKRPPTKRLRRFTTGLALGLVALLGLASLSVSARRQNQSTNSDAVVAAQASSQGAAKSIQPGAEFVPGDILIRYRGDEKARLREMAAAPLHKNGREIAVDVRRFEGSHLVDGLRLARVSPEDTLDAIAALRTDPDVLYAEPNYIRHKDVLPNDPRFNEVWALKNTGQQGNVGYPVNNRFINGTPGADIDAELAWNTTTGSASVVVAIIDTGIDILHPDLAANIWVNPGEIPANGIDDDNNGKVDDVNGWDFDGSDNTVYDGGASDPDDHGTHVAGTIGAKGNNGIGVTGINWNVKLMPLKFLSGPDGTGTDANAIAAFDYAKMMRDRGVNLRVINCSWGGGGGNQAVKDAIDRVGQSGILVVAAGGNDGVSSDDYPHYPASFDSANLIRVAATDRIDDLVYFSNFGTRLPSLGAPGRGILSTTPRNYAGSTYTEPDGSTYSFFSGTSMAAPQVSGVASLLLAQYPTITVQRLRGALLYSGEGIPSLADKVQSARRLNANLALINGGLALNDATPPAISGLSVTAQTGRSVTLQFTTGDDGTAGNASLYDVYFTSSSTGVRFHVGSFIPTASGNPQSLTVLVPYKQTLGTIALTVYDKAGNNATAQTGVTISAADSEPYTTSLSAATPLTTGGTPLSLIGDDQYRFDYALPFDFPFYGKTVRRVHVSTNGILYISPPQERDGSGETGTDASNSRAKLNLQAMIAGMWDDLRTDRLSGDVFVVTPDANRIIFRWQGTTYDTPLGIGTSRGEHPINFEIELRRDGTIQTHYGAGNENVRPLVGISGGQADFYTSGPEDSYVVASHTSTSLINLTNAQTVTFTPAASGPACSYSISPTSLNFSVAGGAGATVSVTTGSTCAWTATSNDSFITITGGASGTGNGTVTYSVAANPTATPRTGTMTIAGQTFTVTQDAASCSYSLTSSAQGFASAGGTGSTNLTTLAGCAWNANSNVAWITVTSGASGTGNGTVNFSVAANTGTQRTGTINIGGQTFTITQASGCTYSISPGSRNHVAAGGANTVTVTTDASCPWTATSNDPSFITITSGASGVGSGAVNYSVTANTTASPRTGSINIAGQTFTVTQDGLGCSYSITPTSQNFGSSAGTGLVNVTATAGCGWQAVSNDPSFITITSGTSGTGNGAVNFSVTANPNPNQRTGSITIAGQTFTVSQDGVSCSYAINPHSQNFNGTAGAGSIQVTATSGCGWIDTSNAPWLSITSAGSGSGNGTVTYAVAANPGQARTGTISIAGQIFTVTQDALPLTVQLAQNSYSVNESAGSIAILVNRAGDLSSAVSVSYTTTDASNFLQNCSVTNGRATSRCDYISLVGTLHFAAGENSKTLFLPIVDDTYLEGPETFFLSLSNPTGGITLGVNQSATITLTDNGNEGIGSGNPIDNPTFFVRQHYMDFLGREPDPSATAWVTQINQCAPADQSCRLSVSQGIYNSPEFKDRGYFIYKFYAVALGRKPSYDEFVLDRARVSGFQSDAELEQSKLDFIADFMSRPEFGGYNGLTNDQYVQTLFNVSGITQVTVNGVVRTVSAMQQQLNGGSRSRGQILRDIAESPEVSARFLIESTIVMHYFGYLRRDPDAAYQDWINIYNQTGDSRNVTNGFVNSLEYRNRFGP